MCHIFTSDNDVKPIIRHVISQETQYPESVFGWNDSDTDSLFFQVCKRGESIREKNGICIHVYICLFGILLSEWFQLVGVSNSRKDAERFFKRFPNGAFDHIISDTGVAMSLEYASEAGYDATRRVCQCIVKVE